MSDVVVGLSGGDAMARSVLGLEMADALHATTHTFASCELRSLSESIGVHLLYLDTDEGAPDDDALSGLKVPDPKYRQYLHRRKVDMWTPRNAYWHRAAHLAYLRQNPSAVDALRAITLREARESPAAFAIVTDVAGEATPHRARALRTLSDRQRVILVGLYGPSDTHMIEQHEADVWLPADTPAYAVVGEIRALLESPK